MADLTALERAELAATVAAMTDDAWKVEVLAQLRRVNGTVADHNDDLYGNPDRQVRGIKPQVAAHELAIDRSRVRFQTILAILGMLGVGNIVAWLRVLA